MNKGVSSWFHNVSTYSEEVIEKKNSLKIHLNNLDLIWICESPIAFVKNIEC
jgi:hypothetical protein